MKQQTILSIYPAKIHVQIIHQSFFSQAGFGETWGVIIDGKPRCTFYSKQEVDAFLEAIQYKKDGMFEVKYE